jgi:hypothetical protein
MIIIWRIWDIHQAPVYGLMVKDHPSNPSEYCRNDHHRYRNQNCNAYGFA